MFYIDPTYFWYVFIPTILISLGVQLYLRSTFSRWSNVRNSTGQAGVQVVKQLFDRITGEVRKVFVGQDELVLGTLVALFSSGHVLIESVPGWARRSSSAPWARCWGATSAASSSLPT